MGQSAMGKYLPLAAKTLREEADRKRYQVAGSLEKRVDPSTVYRFESATGWPHNPDDMIDLYAADLEIEPFEIWALAMQLWRDDEASGRDPATGGNRGPGDAGLPPPPGELGRRVQAPRRSTPDRAPRRRRRAEDLRQGGGG